ncbi:MAG: GNAT family N-acetyltransferase [Patescibacteria group bacterium]
MRQVNNFGDYRLYPLTEALARRYAEDICASQDQIPLVEKHTLDQLLAVSNDKRVFHKKWDHSLIALTTTGAYAGIIIGYEREKENNERYPYNSIYVGSFAVAQKHQKKGLGKALLQAWLGYNKQKGFLALDGKLRFSLQTNSAAWNKHIQALYESFGFKKIATKTYDNRVDNVYFL